jgi:hypothetical protein
MHKRSRRVRAIDPYRLDYTRPRIVCVHPYARVEAIRVRTMEDQYIAMYILFFFDLINSGAGYEFNISFECFTLPFQGGILAR